MRPLHILALALAPILLAAIVGAGTAWWILASGTAHIPLNDQAMSARLPDGLPVRVEVVQARGADGNVLAGGLPVRLNETLKLDVDFDTEVPLALTVRYRGEIPVKTEVPVDTRIQTQVLGVPMELPIQGTIPLDFDLPVDLAIPIEQPVRMRFTAPITAHVDQVVDIPLSGILDARISFDGGQPIPLRVDDTELALPLEYIWLSGRESDWSVGPITPYTD